MSKKATKKKKTRRVGFAGTDLRTFFSAWRFSLTGEIGDYLGFVIGTSSFIKVARAFAQLFNWRVDFISVEIGRKASNEEKAVAYAAAITTALQDGTIEYALVMPEQLYYDGVVDKVDEKYRDRIAGFLQKDSFIEGDKLKAHEFMKEIGVPLARKWVEVADVRNRKATLDLLYELFYESGGCALIYRGSAGGKGSLVAREARDVPKIYKKFVKKFKSSYLKSHGTNPWPALAESLLTGEEMSVTILIDKYGKTQILPSVLDFPYRFLRPPGEDNEVSGGMASWGPHPLWGDELIEIIDRKIARVFAEAFKERGMLRPMVLYPGIFVKIGTDGKILDVWVSEVNIRLGEPEAEPILMLTKNWGELVIAMFEGRLDKVKPDFVENQIVASIACVTGKCEPTGQAGYPWSSREGEVVVFDQEFIKFLKNKRRAVTVGISAMEHDGEKFRAGAGRVGFMMARINIPTGDKFDLYKTTIERASMLEARFKEAFYGNDRFPKGIFSVLPSLEEEDHPTGNRLTYLEDTGLVWADMYETYRKRNPVLGISKEGCLNQTVRE